MRWRWNFFDIPNVEVLIEDSQIVKLAYGYSRGLEVRFYVDVYNSSTNVLLPGFFLLSSRRSLLCIMLEYIYIFCVSVTPARACGNYRLTERYVWRGEGFLKVRSPPSAIVVS
jgi:hypothetical protein